ncbi:hypothetical protein D4764_05G0006180 [Takifugu flavidus]|uniref:Uncharacterized protein n=1 Tax=Takifugu flavidus TaxID=433684 RepID=A0A5C6N1C4_9TELE|nr:hypothetical protein D4764_05G0006180 [Takifugu flavidus]
MAPLVIHLLSADRKEQSNRSRTAQKGTRSYCCVPLTLANPHLAPGQHQRERACQQKAGQNGTGRRAPNWAQMAATDKDGGGMNMLINNYQNSDMQ